ncbi:MAG: hypothetical protein QOH66_616, partial [Actinomycetota bacterium]|nr:hypothetical protein [Actinomycetota bacterium]
MAALTEDLELNIQPALGSVADLAAELTKAALDFSSTLSDSLASALAGIDPSPLEATLTEAVAAADTTVTLDTPDTSVLTSDITDAVAAADTSVTVGSADASVVTTDIDAAVTASDTAVTVGPVDASE